ncbi:MULTISPECIES: TIGR01212 family radical SAM protein [Desulfovibrio]|uniref:Radical SAM core domain-containing protein n=1 Tax=Desulfovibrio desulfuricans TaxID=876 RepID=A0AA94HUV4_DESDE|nr:MULTISPECIES: radical SAM protein [Desulfovibrio]SFW69034.1 hypothetical protein SAMN02910291_02531 [Desulfovibrio desulfuricans]SPD35601.1 Elongator protein 3/MiaB/NifB [Desulfovibrio sp. G11]
MLRWHTLAVYFRRKYGTRVQKIPLDAGASCPNRDGSLSHRGCTFCNASGSGSGLGVRGFSLEEQWRAWLEKYRATDADRAFMAYLQSYSNTYGPPERLQLLLQQVAALPGCLGVAVGTRPDCLGPHKLDMLAACRINASGNGPDGVHHYTRNAHGDNGYKKGAGGMENGGLSEVWLELGLQSAHNATLRRINRGHDAACSETAVRQAAERGLAVCGHLMAGLPGEDEAAFLESLDWALSLPLSGLKLHNVYVPRGTSLARLYEEGGYHPLARDEYVDLLCTALPRIPSAMVMHRVQSDPAPGELLAPAWAAEKRGVITDLRRALTARDLWQGKTADVPDMRPEWYGG